MTRLIVTTIASLSIAAVTDACTCEEMSLEGHLCASTAVFTGQVISVDTSEGRGYEGVLARVRVMDAWRRVHPGDTVVVATYADDGACGYRFGAAYANPTHLIFAAPVPKKPWLTTNSCSGSRLLGYAGAYLDTLQGWRRAGTLDPGRTSVVVEVREIATGRPIGGAAVYLGYQGARTDSTGRAVLSCLPAGRGVLYVRSPGFESATDTVNVERGVRRTLKVALRPLRELDRPR